jgi:REP element-mobilizing transposase RayT
MVAAYHLVWTAYGWWLPNDPRGSMSQVIRQDIIADLGELHYGRKRLQPSGKVIRKFYEEAKLVLKHELRTFTDEEVQLIATSLAEVISKERYTCYACAIMPDHVHIVIRKHKHQAEEMIANLQERSWEALITAQRRCSDHPVWGGPGWKVFLDSREDIERTIRYVRDNPVKIGRPVQVYDFVKDYDGWLPGIGPYRKL